MLVRDTDDFPRFHKILGSRNHEEVVDQITLAIRAGKYVVGDFLPTIEDMATEMGVSKPTVGEALNVLATKGVVAKKRGSKGGVTVLTTIIPEEVLGLAASARDLTPKELVEARRPVEQRLCLLAAERGTPEDFDLLDGAVAELIRARDTAQEQPEVWAYCDNLFHYLLARTARSEGLAHYQHEIMEQLSKKLSDYFLSMENPETVIELHRETSDAIKSRDELRILAAVDRHLRPLELYVDHLTTASENHS